jgi:hypothetical protein
MHNYFINNLPYYVVNGIEKLCLLQFVSGSVELF